jgi:hypothetical protein
MSDRAKLAADFIVSHCPRLGAFHGDSEPHIFLRETAVQMNSAKPTAAFPDRYLEHVAYALDSIANNMFLSPAAAVASVFLATRFEFYFRILSGKLNGDGTWVSERAKQTAIVSINDTRLNQRKVSSVSLAYQLMRLQQSNISHFCTQLDSVLYSSPTTAVGNFPISHLGDRIEFGRNSVGHGQLADISAEAVFYGLLTALTFYAQGNNAA